MIDPNPAVTVDSSSQNSLMSADEELFHPDPEEMLVLLSSENVLERMQAARAFCEIQDHRAIPKLILLLEDTCTLVRVSAAYALGRNPVLSLDFLTQFLPELSDHFSIVDYLIAKLSNEWNGYVRKGIVWTLGNYKDVKALNPLVSALKYDIAAVRLWAASALGQLGQPQAVDALTSALISDHVAGVRSNCAWALGKLLIKVSDRSPQNDTYQSAIDALVNAIDDIDLGVQSDAKVTLRRLGDPRGLKVLEKIDYEQGYCDYPI
ncbi:HEAT-like repeat protein [Synechococcus sp. PCC 7502]|uniref:HEAT repeat domain-containing protein n=1 Tax=Synechococcus sp. PCC 7502 TaxID=1173263 RepID=UPI00029F9EEB|nr:HEAT repeat domain-containing protein [Synechococcus sp. PCC 7502]AFY73239.1 HEAT-like repeat protein [Synechococcus sp. PCC 7502]